MTLAPRLSRSKAIPRTKTTGTSGEVHSRAKERRAWMQNQHPGTRFSLHVPNGLGVKSAKELGEPGAGLPSAVYTSKDIEEVKTKKFIKQVYESWRQWRTIMGYVRYTTIQEDTGLYYPVIFGVIKHLHGLNPKALRFAIQSTGRSYNIAFKITDPKWVEELLEKDG